IASVILLTIIGAFITEKIVEPRLGAYTGEYKEKLEGLAATEKKGLIWAGISTIVTIILIALLVLPSNAPLWLDGVKFVESTFMEALFPIVVILFFVPGLVYVIVTKEIKNDKVVANSLAKTMRTMGTIGPFIILAFTAGQFVAFFFESNMR